MVWVSTSSGKIELDLVPEDAATACLPGKDATPAINILRKKEYIKAQLAKHDPAVVAAELKEYGAWDAEELKDHEANLNRLLWVLCGDLNEEQKL